MIFNVDSVVPRLSLLLDNLGPLVMTMMMTVVVTVLVVVIMLHRGKGRASISS
jgi:hypothetical protein